MLELESSLSQIRAGKGNTSILLQVPWISRNPQIIETMRLIVTEEQLFTEIYKRYKYKHQKYISAKAKVERLYQKRDKVVEEIRDSTISERGARIDDKRSEAAMEKRKQQGYF